MAKSALWVRRGLWFPSCGCVFVSTLVAQVGLRNAQTSTAADQLHSNDLVVHRCVYGYFPQVSRKRFLGEAGTAQHSAITQLSPRILTSPLMSAYDP